MSDSDPPPTFQTAGQRLPGIIEGLDCTLPAEVRKTARVLADVVGDFRPDGRNVSWAGTRDPGAVATACIYVADYAIRHGDRCTQEWLATQAPGTHPTIRRNYREIPRVFFEHATDEDLSKLDDDVVDTLDLFREMAAGPGINHLSLADLERFDPPYDDAPADE